MTENLKISAREQAIQAINEGGVVIIPTKDKPEGQMFSLRGNPDTNTLSIAKLPSEAEFAFGDSVAEKDALENIEQQMAELNRLKSMLGAKAEKEVTEVKKDVTVKNEKENK